MAAIVESSDDAIISKTLEGIITSWNQGAQRIFGYAPDEIIGQNIAVLAPPDRLEEELEILKRLRLGERIDHFETVRLTKDGRRLDVSISVSPIRNARGVIIGASKISRDITERKANEESSRRRDAELAHLSRVSAMGNMASGLAHELNQPLGAILNYASVGASLLRSSPIATEKLQNALNGVLTETRRASAIISRLRSFVSKQAPKSQPVELNELTHKTVSFLDFEMRQHGVTVILLLAGKSVTVLADAIQIEQVLVNLMNNAAQAMSESKSPVRSLVIEIQIADQEFAKVSVADTGPGMNQEQFVRLFEPFYTTKAQGLGIGLNISRSIVENHGGRLTATMNPTCGMKFSFTLPLKLGHSYGSTAGRDGTYR